jgi:hypothetical protein
VGIRAINPFCGFVLYIVALFYVIPLGNFRDSLGSYLFVYEVSKVGMFLIYLIV